jgi:hypothetical protein
VQLSATQCNSVWCLYSMSASVPYSRAHHACRRLRAAVE